MAVAEGMPCPDCRVPMKALGTTTYCARCEDAAVTFALDEITAPVLRCPKCSSVDVIMTTVRVVPGGWDVRSCGCLDCGEVTVGV